jgi:hypothetical protein
MMSMTMMIMIYPPSCSRTGRCQRGDSSRDVGPTPSSLKVPGAIPLRIATTMTSHAACARCNHFHATGLGSAAPQGDLGRRTVQPRGKSRSGSAVAKRVPSGVRQAVLMGCCHLLVTHRESMTVPGSGSGNAVVEVGEPTAFAHQRVRVGVVLNQLQPLRVTPSPSRSSWLGRQLQREQNRRFADSMFAMPGTEQLALRRECHESAFSSN